MGDESNFDEQGNYFLEVSTRLKDMEEKQRIIKDRLLLVGNNLIETRQDTHKEVINIKKDLASLKNDLERMKSFMETISDEFSNFARKDDLDILIKQSKMFQPLELVTKSDLEKLKKK